MLSTITAPRIKGILTAIAISALTYPVQAQEPGGGLYLACHLEEKEAEGEWSASRYLAVTSGAIRSTRDSYTWQPKERISFGPGMTLRWEIAFDWRSQDPAPKVIPEEKVVVVLDFWYDARYLDKPVENPERSGIHFYRSANQEEEFSSSTPSLTGNMHWQKFNNGNLSTKAVMPLDYLLAFGAGFDTLVWNIRTEPNRFGGTHALAKGDIPISVMRGKVAKIPKLRRLLDKKSANFRTQCHAPVPSPPDGS